MPGASAPAASRGKTKTTRVSHHGYAGPTRHSRTRLVLTVSFVVSLVNRAFLPPSPAERESILAGLTPASGCQDATTSPSASVPFVVGHQDVHRIPRPTFVTMAKRPSSGTGRAGF